MLNLTAACPLEWDTEDALTEGKMLHVLRTQVAEEAVDRAQTHVAGAGGIMTRGLQVFEEREDTLDGDMLDGDMLDLELGPIAHRIDYELQEEL